MKITVERPSAAHELQAPLNPRTPSDLSEKPILRRKPPRRKTKNSGGGVRLKREPSGKRSSRPETPLLRWKYDEGNGKESAAEEEEEKSGEGGRKSGGRRSKGGAVSARKLAAGLWRLRLPEGQSSGVGQNLGLQVQSGGGHFGANIHCHNADRVHSSPAHDQVHSPHSVSGPRHGLFHKIEPSFQFPNYAMEGATKWDPDGWKPSEEAKQIFSRPKSPNHQSAAAASLISTLEAELNQARSRINDLETERRSSKKKLEQFLRKLSEERAAWRSREHEKVRAIIDDMKSGLSREKKNRQRLEIVNSKLVNELADIKLSAKRYMQEYEKERKARELIEEVCDELAKEIGEDKAEVEALKRESMHLREEVDEERKMLQMAEVWREERVQMKLVDAKVMLEEKYAQMNALVENLQSFLNSTSMKSDAEEVKKAEFLRQVAASVSMQDVRELAYEPPNPDDIFSVFEDVNFGERQEEEDEPPGGDGGAYSPASRASKVHTVSPEMKTLNKNGSYRHSNNMYSGELEEDASEWETVSHPDDQGSSYSPDGSDPSIYNHRNFHITNGGEESPYMEMSEGDLAKMRQLKKASSISKLWRSVDGKNGRLSNGRLSNGATATSPGGLSPQEWSSPDSGNPHISRAMKGCIEWPRSSNAQKGSLKSRLMEARMESQKVQLRQVLKQKI